MSSILRLSQSTPTAASQVPFYDPTQGQDRRFSITELAEVLQALLTVGGSFTHQYAAPSATGFSVTVAPPTTGASVYLLLTPVAGYAAGTVVMPAAQAHGQEVLVSCTQSVTTLTVSGNGKTVTGAPTTLAANAFFRMRYDGVLGGWYRIG